jgi:large-conductance mechanosensitive channel
MKYLITFSLIGLFIIFIAVKKLRDIHRKKTAPTNKSGEKTNENNP